MTTVAVPRESNASCLVADQNIDACAIEGGAKCIGVQCLPPLAIGFLVACAAVLGCGIRTWLEKPFTLYGYIARGERILRAIVEVISRSNSRVKRFAIRSCTFLGAGL